ncbi:MAG: N-acetylmuramoyl-L-alanine amidase [Desulfobacterales bacterium]|nr:N-acetylmuramoyl-L-alanine amidase [Desulfobacterales bacterium]MDD4072795.1 N-acetylmuramoyl-L-alanine amidase [Desulfobacterales bacterium]MDD4393357.1 N-acetylmuramoyl-L-alanine amidase [Desulfobacterales bacterium]
MKSYSKAACVASGMVALWCLTVLWLPEAEAAASAKEKYFIAERAYKHLINQPSKQKYRDNWLSCIKKYQAVFRHDPSGPWAAAGLYMSGNLYQELYKRSFKAADQSEAIDIYQRIIKRFPKSGYSKKAAREMHKIGDVKSKKTSRGKPSDGSNHQGQTAGNKAGRTASSPVSSKASDQKPSQSTPVDSSTSTLTGLRFWSNPNYTRIVIDADNEPAYSHHLLKKDPSLNKPQRLYVDMSRSRLGKGIDKVIPINDDLLRDARAGQFTSDSVRVVVDIKSFETYKIFSLKNPFRIVIDVWGKSDKSSYHAEASKAVPAVSSKILPGALAKQLALGVHRIVIDPGHGGRDFGAPGFMKGIHEKHITLAIAKKLAEKIRNQLHCEVVLTRSDDRYLTLEERTAIANTRDGDLFISIHTNASTNRMAYGIETYFLNLATDDDAIRVAARENATSTKNISDLQSILNDLMKHAKINESSRLAVYTQQSLCSQLKKKYGNIKSKGVKQAPFYVLLGAQMPSILVETSFVSNSRECKRLVNSSYQDQICDGILTGIRQYIMETNPTAFSTKKGGIGANG